MAPTAALQRESGGNLVSLYTTRLQKRTRRAPSTLGRSTTAYTGVMTFGRMKTRRTIERSGSNRLVASALAATAMLVGAGGTAAASTVHWVQPGETLNEISMQYEKAPEEVALLNSITDYDFLLAGNLLMIEPSENDGNHIGPKHLIEPGDTLEAIAARYGVTIDDLAQANGIANHDLIYAGEDLTIPIGIRPPGQWNHYADYAEVNFDEVREERAGAAQTVSNTSTSTPVAETVPSTPSVSTPVAPAPSTQQQPAPAPAPSTPAPAPTTPAPTPTPTPAPQQNTNQQAAFGLHLVISGETLGGIAARYGMPVSVLAEYNNLSTTDELSAGRLLRIPLDRVTNGTGV